MSQWTLERAHYIIIKFHAHYIILCDIKYVFMVRNWNSFRSRRRSPIKTTLIGLEALSHVLFCYTTYELTSMHQASLAAIKYN